MSQPARRSWMSRAAIAAMAFASMASAKPTPKPVFALVDVDRIGEARLAALKAHAGVTWWVEADDRMLVALRDHEAEAALTADSYRVSDLGEGVSPSLLYVVPKHFAATVVKQQGGRVLARGGRLALVQLARPQAIFYTGDDFRGAVVPVVKNSVLAHQAANTAAKAADFPREVVDGLDAEKWKAHLERLSAMNRYTHGAGVIEARDYIAAQLRALPGMDVRVEEFKVGSTVAYNVVGTLTGSESPDDLYVVGAHYDAISESPTRAAPGAEDNGSGTAGMIELARVFAEHPPKASMAFIAFSGEEQGLHGSKDYVKRLVAAGSKAHVKRALIMDMIAYTKNADLDCVLETHSRNADMVRELTAAAQAATKLRIVTSYDYWGSDHVPFIDNGIPAVLTIENDYGDYPSYHRSTDTMANISVEMGMETLKMNAAALGKWVLQ